MRKSRLRVLRNAWAKTTNRPAATMPNLIRRRVKRAFFELRRQNKAKAARNVKALTTREKLKLIHPDLTFAEAGRSHIEGIRSDIQKLETPF